MNFKEKFKQLAAAAGFSAVDIKPDAQKVAEQMQRAKIAESQAIAGLAQLRQEKFQSEAETFVASEIKAGRMFPSEKKVFESLFVQAAIDDAAHPLATGSRLDVLKATQETRKPHRFTEELLDPESKRPKSSI